MSATDRIARLVTDVPPEPLLPAAQTLWTVRARQAVEYEVVLTTGLLDPANDALAVSGSQEAVTRRLVVIDQRVHELYGDRFRDYFRARSVDTHWLVLDACEQNKTLDAVLGVVDALVAHRVLRRSEPVIAVGGGVLTDIVGMACGMYRRGIPYVKVPTTLIGLVDAGIGAKTGVNHGSHKNRLGSYFPARSTLLDRAFLATLDDRHLSNGLAEILKIALVRDPPLFDLLEWHGALLRGERMQGLTFDGEHAAAEVVARAVGGMLAELEPNLWEHDLERLVDYGHTFSPALEMRALPVLLHGEAVAIDMALTTVIACRRGMLGPADRDRVLAVVTALGLPLTHLVCLSDVLCDALADAVLHRDGRQRLPLPTGIGSACFVDDLTHEEIRGAVHELRERGRTHD
ncbi:MAG: sedoheptulose 7-phosphate cyclase [Pseudonocardiaceae bacterium]